MDRNCWMKNFKGMVFFVVVLLSFVCAIQSCSFAAGNSQQSKKYAVVDVAKVVNSSQSVKELKQERTAQKEAINKFLKEGNAQLNAEKDKAKKAELKKKLNNDLKLLTQNFDKQYQEKLLNANKEIISEINKIGKERQYDLILTTDSVLYGGEDITDELVKEVK